MDLQGTFCYAKMVGEKAGDYGREAWRNPLPREILRLRERSFSVFVSNLPAKISTAKVQAMFFRARRIVDVFLPRDRSSGNTRGFTFVRFATCKEAEKAIEMAEGKSRVGRKILVNMAKFPTSRMGITTPSGDMVLPSRRIIGSPGFNAWKGKPGSHLEVLSDGF